MLRCLIATTLLLALTHFVLPAEAADTSIRTDDLRCEYLVDPLGIDDLQPRLSWKLIPADHSVRGKKQSAYRVLVASSRMLLEQDRGDLWDSGKVTSDQSHLVRFQGTPLKSRMNCWWKVLVWDETDHAADWSPVAHWSMGLLDDQAWRDAKWIGLRGEDQPGIDTSDILKASWLWYPEGNASIDAPVETRYFRRSIVIPNDRRIKNAWCFFAGDDVVTFYVNGAHLGTGRGHPSLVGADIAGQLKPGVNELAVANSNGAADVPANPAGWIGVVRVEFEQGAPLLFLSDASWKSAGSVDEGWQTAAFDQESWVGAMELGRAGIAPWGIPWKDRWQSEHRRLPARYLRRQFQLDPNKEIRQATAFVCGLGFFDLYVNGGRIGDSLMNPALTGYDRRALYVTYDVTDSLRTGANALGVVLSNGRFFAPRDQNPMPMHNYGQPRMIAQLHVEYSDGSEDVLVSDESWKVTESGPVRASNEFDGEEYDARMEMPGWSAAAFDDATWSAADVMPPPGGKLEAQMVEPIRVTQILKPVQIVQPKPGIWMLDFGQAFYGVVRLRVSGPAGTQVSMKTSFNVLPDGTLNSLNDRSARNTDVYTLRGPGVETWHPRFRGNATRWVQVEGFPGTPTAESFAGLVTHTDHQPVGEFSCSNELINKVYSNARWGTRLQNRSVPMEPDRDERMPWSGHPAKTSESEGWVFHVARFYEHFLHNYREHQAPDGSLQEILPPYWLFNSRDIIWPSVVTIIPDWYYNFYGDDRLLRENYDMMKRFVAYHVQTNLKPDDTMDHCAYGDWVDTASIGGNSRNFGATSRPLMATAYLYHNCRIVERAAKLQGHADDERRFRELADRIRIGFHRRFFDPVSGTYESGTQCSCILPLAFGLVPEEHRPRLIEYLSHDIAVTHNGHTSVGLIGTQWQMQVLTEIGRPDLGFSIATRTARPSWGYMISKGATTIWERWDTDTQDGGMNGESQKILSGNYEAWCYQTLGGIHYDPQHPGFKHIILRPQLVGDLQWVNASHESVYGTVVSRWKRTGNHFVWQVTVPPNTTATAFLPTGKSSELQESGMAIGERPGIRILETRPDVTVVNLESGTYQFSGPR
ncbi:MAG: family 78 glycoside hydrolase catalytic domain [Planctomycetaceae bacterium]|nr:family 78 glycoside hydrolase catalytic domain [Planctomycetaceae bacterium]